MKQRLTALLLCLVLTFSLCSVHAFAAEETAPTRDFTLEESLAADLKALGLFKGVSATDFNLGGTLDRVGAAVMLVRLLGKEQAAAEAAIPHPFTDVPKWAATQLGYASKYALVTGTSPTTYNYPWPDTARPDPNRAEAYTYLTMVLRALGYSSAPGGDFAWNDPFPLAREVGILPAQVDTDNFLRADVVLISYAALNAKLKDSRQTLAEKLMAAGVFTRTRFESCYDPNALAPVELTAQQVAAQCSPAVCLVETWSFNGEPRSQGSAFFLSSDGLAVTNYHVVENAQDIVLTLPDGRVFSSVAIVGYDAGNDLALLKVEASGLPHLILGDSGQVQQGQTIYTLGNPKGLTGTMSQGIVANSSRVLDGVEYIQISAPIDHGSSGGALLDQYGRVVGVTSAGLESTADLNLAIPSNAVGAMAFDLSADLILFGDDPYPGFNVIPDFGVFSGLELLNVTSDPLGYHLEYDVWDFYDWNGLDSASRYAYTLYYYYQHLMNNGFVQTDGGDSFYGSFLWEDECISIVPDLDRGVILVAAQYIPRYYADHPAVPDFGWYSGLPVYGVPGDYGGSRMYSYFWGDDYTPEEMELLMADYCDLLVLLGYEYIPDNELHAFRKDGKWVFLSLTDSFVFLEADL